MKKNVAAKYLMIGAICTIAAFQTYWLFKLYNEEYSSIKRKADVILKETILSLQESTIKTDSNFIHFLSQKKTESKIEFVGDTIRQRLTTKEEKRKNLENGSITDTNINVTYITQQSSTLKANRMADSILSHINPNAIRSIHITKDSSFKTRGTIIIRSNMPGNNDSMRAALLKALSKDTNRLREISSNIKLKKAGPEKAITAKAFKEKFTKNQLEKHPLPGKDPLNISNLVIKLFTDSIPPKKVDSVFKQSLTKEKILLPYTLFAKRVLKDSTNIIDTTRASLHTNPITIGLVKPMAYQAQFDQPLWFIIKRIGLAVSISILLLSFVTLAFVFLYRNMIAQSKLANLKSDFISNVSHELKTPIATVSVAIEALKNFNALEDKKRAQDYLDISSMEINRLSLLVENVLKLSIFENEKMELHKEQFDIAGLTQEVVSALSIQVANKQASIQIDAKPAYILINADKLQIASIFFNLLDNALKYCKEKPQILITLLQDNGTIKIKVRDNGIGISKDNQKKIFEKFFRVQSGDRHNVKGYGLGLSYVNHIIKQHKGTISMVSELGKGSEFVIVLPV